jgi:hypothetical protein
MAIDPNDQFNPDMARFSPKPAAPQADAFGQTAGRPAIVADAKGNFSQNTAPPILGSNQDKVARWSNPSNTPNTNSRSDQMSQIFNDNANRQYGPATFMNTAPHAGVEEYQNQRDAGLMRPPPMLASASGWDPNKKADTQRQANSIMNPNNLPEPNPNAKISPALPPVANSDTNLRQSLGSNLAGNIYASLPATAARTGWAATKAVGRGIRSLGAPTTRGLGRMGDFLGGAYDGLTR